MISNLAPAVQMGLELELVPHQVPHAMLFMLSSLLFNKPCSRFRCMLSLIRYIVARFLAARFFFFDRSAAGT